MPLTTQQILHCIYLLLGIFIYFWFRCNDANLIEIPVEVETADHHYYHVWHFSTFTNVNDISDSTTFYIDLLYFVVWQLAFFTARDVKAFEELSWVSYFVLFYCFSKIELKTVVFPCTPIESYFDYCNCTNKPSMRNLYASRVTWFNFTQRLWPIQDLGTHELS